MGLEILWESLLRCLRFRYWSLLVLLLVVVVLLLVVVEVESADD